MSLFNFFHHSRLVLASAALALAGGVIGTGCGGSDASTIQGFCTALAQADCSAAVVTACYGSSDATLATDIDSCIRARSATSTCNPGNLPYHPDFADNCIAAHQVAFAESTVTADRFKAMHESCLGALNRAGSQGEQCTNDSDCDFGYQNLRCLVRFGGKGTCQVPLPVTGGASCKDPTAQCPTGTYCDEGFHCVETPLKGETCGAGQPCSDGLQCNTVSDVCDSQLPNNSSCSRDSECQGGFCIGSGTGSSGKCAASYVFAFGALSCSSFSLQ
jgi:hypothetical protein